MRSAASRLFSSKDPFDTEKTDSLFVDAIRENVTFHRKNCPAYREMLAARNFTPDLLTDPDSLAKLPCLPTLLFKRHHLFSIPEEKLPVRATSSGTGGQYSRIGLDWKSLFLGSKMVLRMAHWRELLSLRPTQFFILGYEPHKGNEMAVMKTALGSTFFAPAIRRHYALRWKDGQYAADLESILAQLQKAARGIFPVRFMGFPSYTYFLLKTMQERGIRCILPRHSRIMLGGGWKAHIAQQVDKQVLYDLIEKVLGVKQSHVVEFFGAVEHPILWTDCPAHHFHVPVYARVLIRDVQTLEPVPHGQPGLVNLLTPMIRACPLTSILTDDIGILRDEPCSCGIRSPWLELCGRTGLQDIRTCAAGAAELLKGAVS